MNKANKEKIDNDKNRLQMRKTIFTVVFLSVLLVSLIIIGLKYVRIKAFVNDVFIINKVNF